MIFWAIFVKVTPSSKKFVGDIAAHLFMVQEHHLTEQDVFRAWAFCYGLPGYIVVEMFSGDLGQPYGGYPKSCKKIILKGKSL